MKILITGGSGFVGRNIARVLKARGHEILTPTHSELDMSDLGKILNYYANNQFDAIVHSAFKGHFASDNTHEDFVYNMKMFENLSWADAEFRPTFIIGSGAEFDRRFDIKLADEDSIFTSWPVDLYGLSKNIISRRTLSEEEIQFPFVLRLFGCFGADEPDFRFIKRSIMRIENGLPIEIKKNKKMDFFFVDDVAIVIENILLNNLHNKSNINLTYFQNYDHRHTLVDIGLMIYKEMNIDPDIVVKESGMDKEYTGSSLHLPGTNLVGLENGIKQMVKELTK